MSFFKLEDGQVFEATQEVTNKEYTLRIEQHAEYSYPVDGWYYFETIEEAYTFFGVNAPSLDSL